MLRETTWFGWCLYRKERVQSINVSEVVTGYNGNGAAVKSSLRLARDAVLLIRTPKLLCLILRETMANAT